MKYNENMTASDMSATGGFVQNSGGPNLIITSFEKSENTQRCKISLICYCRTKPGPLG
jgi:hypothetical protein